MAQTFKQLEQKEEIISCFLRNKKKEFIAQTTLTLL